MSSSEGCLPIVNAEGLAPFQSIIPFPSSQRVGGYDPLTEGEGLKGVVERCTETIHRIRQQRTSKEITNWEEYTIK